MVKANQGPMRMLPRNIQIQELPFLSLALRAGYIIFRPSKKWKCGALVQKR